MGSRRIFTLLGIVSLALVAALPAAAKEGVHATLETAIPLDAPAGTHLKVRWKLGYADENGVRRPFGANGVFVRFLSGTGAGVTTGFAPSGAYENGRFSATVVVPEGGIRDVQVGLRGFTSGANGTHNADQLFPITNDPMPGVARVHALPARTNWARWVLVAVILGAALAVVVSGGIALARRRPRGALSSG